MSQLELGVILNGVTGRMGTNQHLIRSINAIREQGGVSIEGGDTIMPTPLLVGRNADKLKALSERTGGHPWTTDLDRALADAHNTIYFDGQVTDQRVSSVSQAIEAGKHVYCEKPTATNLDDALRLYKLAIDSRVKHGVVQDKLWLPGILKLKNLIDSGFFGKILSVRGEFGYWVFTGGDPAQGGDGFVPQRPSWNYRKEDGGGIIFDMLAHWRYVLDNLFGAVKAVSCIGATHIPIRWNEAGEAYSNSADDAAYATFELEAGVIVQFNSSWCVRVKRDDLLTIQVDGTAGSAVAGLRDCFVQSLANTPRPVWNPDVPSTIAYDQGWTSAEDLGQTENAFKAEWELFLRHVVTGSPFQWDLREGAKGVQLAELGVESWSRRSWVDIPDLPIYEGLA